MIIVPTDIIRKHLQHLRLHANRRIAEQADMGEVIGYYVAHAQDDIWDQLDTGYLIETNTKL